MSLEQGRMGTGKRLPGLLLGFGFMLPHADDHAIVDAEETELYDKLKVCLRDLVSLCVILLDIM